VPRIEINGALTTLLFRGYYLMLDQQADAITDVIAECVRKIGGPTIGSIGEIAWERLKDCDAGEVSLGAVREYKDAAILL
jgi:hypothetical protein